MRLVGLAILVAVSTARTNALVTITGDSPTAQRSALTGGFQSALAVGAGFAAIGLIVALFVIRESECRRAQLQRRNIVPFVNNP